jgi:hypothetical protein
MSSSGPFGEVNRFSKCDGAVMNGPVHNDAHRCILLPTVLHVAGDPADTPYETSGSSVTPSV